MIELPLPVLAHSHSFIFSFPNLMIVPPLHHQPPLTILLLDDGGAVVIVGPRQVGDCGPAVGAGDIDPGLRP